MQKRAAFYTLGCKVNQYESARLAGLFNQIGYSVVSEDDAADVYIVNTCTVTRLADRKSRQYIRRMKRLNPDATIVVMGCYPEISREEVEAIPEVDYILGTQDKDKVIELVTGLEHKSCADSPILDPECRTRALIQIEDGCNRFCSYCVIPYARHRMWSKPLENIVSEAKTLVASGYKEIVLTGINTALYEGGVKPVIAALNDLEGDFRIRLSSLEPTIVNAEYVKELLQYDRLCHHLHLSVQSGSDKIVKAMNRHYTIEEYLKIVDVLRSFDPLYGLTTDIITGFPGETEEDFKASLQLVEKAEYLKVHGFPYSQRPYTKAKDHPDQLPPFVKKARNKELIELADAVSLKFREKMNGSVQKVLFEQENSGLWTGHADNFCTVYLQSSDNLSNKYVNIKCVKPFKDGVLAEKI